MGKIFLGRKSNVGKAEAWVCWRCSFPKAGAIQSSFRKKPCNLYPRQDKKLR